MADAPASSHDRWARLRFAIIGPLLAAPPRRGQLETALRALAAQTWRHPLTDDPVGFGFSTIERWYYAARHEERDPVGVLRRQRRRDAGQAWALSLKLREVLRAQYQAHPSWTYQLHADNLAVLVAADATLGRICRPTTPCGATWSATTSCPSRWRRPPPPRARPGGPTAGNTSKSAASRPITSMPLASGFPPGLAQGPHRCRHLAHPPSLGVLDDRSRLACHLQWYTDETAATLVHGLAQAIQKRGLPRALLTDNGAAMLAAEVQQGLARLGIVHETPLPYSAYQNAKLEVFWGQVERRLLAMLEGELRRSRETPGVCSSEVTH